MKKDKIILISFIFLVLSILFFCNSINFQLNESAVKIKENELLEYPRGAGQWNLVNLTINGTAVGPNAHNWSWVESQSWFGGGIGSEVNPYRIENITIANSNGCIEIYNSEEYFILQNCNLYNSSQSISGRGISLANVSNGIIQKNNISQLEYGILLYNCSKIDIYDNFLTKNYYGIIIGDSNRIMIDYNEISGFQEYIGYGIYISFGSFVYSQVQIVSNELSELYTAIFLHHVKACNITLNRIYNNKNGIIVEQCFEINIQTNEIFLIYENAIKLDPLGPSHLVEYNQIYAINGSGILVSPPFVAPQASENYLIQHNHIELCNASGISLVNSRNISVYYNRLNDNFNGISIEGSTYNTLIGNIIENSTNYGIKIDIYYNEFVFPPSYTYSLMNNVSHNIIRNNKEAGIYCYSSDGNVIAQNSIDNNSKGIYLSSFCTLNQISNNDITNHEQAGIIIMDHCEFNTISDNRINYNYCGVNITQDSDGNELIGNNLLHNVICYTIAEDCDDTLLENNLCSTEAPDDFFWIIVLISGLSVAIVAIGIWYYKRRK